MPTSLIPYSPIAWHTTMMRLVASFLSTLILAARRLWNHRLLMLCLLAGLVAAVGLLSSIPLYADAVQHRLLQGELTETGVQRPPFAFLWRYVGAWHGEIDWQQLAPVDEYLSQQAPGAIGLPMTLQVQHARTGNLRLFAAADSQAFQERDPLLWTSIGFVTGLQDHVELVQGTFPAAEAGETGTDVPVLISRALAERMGLQVGERYVLFGSDDGSAQIQIRIAAVWQARDAADPFWFYQPSAFDEALLTLPTAFITQVVPALDKPVALAAWYQVFDGSHVRSAGVPGLLSQIATTQSRAEALLAYTTLDVSPADALTAYQEAARQLTVMLSIFSIPVVGLILYFVALIAGMVVRRSQAEIAILRSRGTTRLQVLLIHLLEGLLVGSAGLAGGLALGRWLAGLMSRTRTFLDPALLGGLTTRPTLEIVFTPAALGYGLLAVGLAVVALLVPALGVSRHTIVTFKWERARALLRPAYQRYFLDLLLLAVPLYGWYLLRRQGTLTLLGSGDDPFANPLLFLVPALFCFALALVAARIFPWLMRLLAWLAGALPGTTLLLTLRQLARSAAQYTGPLLLLSLTLSLAVFTASMAATLDSHLQDQVYYQVGADLNLAEQGESTEQPETPSLLGPTTTTTTRTDEEGPRWLFLPVGEHLRVPGVRAATRVGDYGATSNIGGRQQAGRLLGVDRIDFPATAFFRPDFAWGEPLAGLMNRLAVNRSNLLVSQDFLARNGLAVGDPLRLTVSIAGEVHEIEFTVAGPLALFPTLYPQDGPFFVGNLDYVYEGMGGTFPYDVWLATDPAVPGEQIVAGVRDLRLAVASSSDARATIATEQTRPERQGLFGLLSVGFLAAAALTVLGFLVYAVVSFQRRFIELGMLRAVGLSVAQMAGYLAGEQAMLILAGGGLGTALGIWASILFIPYLQVGAGKTAQVPPFVVQIAWNQLWTIYAVFGAMFIVAVTVLIALLVRMNVFEAVKLGETA
jgi:putative ABC transport system permease protein